MSFCMNCGKELAGEKFCPNCGMPTDGGKPFQAKKQPQAEQGLRARDLIEKAIVVLRQKPIRLWGVSMMCQLLTTLAVILSILPIVWIPIVFVLNAGMTAVYLAGYRGQEVNSDALFAGFKRFFKVAGGMGWMALWIFIWGLIPIAGVVFAVIKMYSYRFVPYIIIQNPDIAPTEALRLSVKRTEGYKGRLFLADFFVGLAYVGILLVFSLLSSIRGIGPVFAVISMLVSTFLALAVPLLMGLISAAGYEEIFVKGSAEQTGMEQ